MIFRRAFMLRSTLYAAAAAGIALAPAVVIAAPSELALVQQHLRAVSTMTATFTQTDRKGASIGGQLTLKRPGRVRFQYEKGVPLLVVGDGNALTMIDYQVNQVSRWPIGSSPLSVLLNPNKDISRFARIVASGDPRLLLLQARDPKRPEFGTITIAFSRNPSAPAGLMLQGWSVVDAQNNRTMVQLSNQRFNVPVSDQAFKWRDPRKSGPRS
jgi:outer membrane lipoprotein-sorting protein